MEERDSDDSSDSDAEEGLGVGPARKKGKGRAGVASKTRKVGTSWWCGDSSLYPAFAVRTTAVLCCVVLCSLCLCPRTFERPSCDVLMRGDVMC